MSPLIRLYPACYNGDIQAKNAGSPDVHCTLYSTHKCIVQQLNRSAGKMPTKHK